MSIMSMAFDLEIKLRLVFYIKCRVALSALANGGRGALFIVFREQPRVPKLINIL